MVFSFLVAISWTMAAQAVEPLCPPVEEGSSRSPHLLLTLPDGEIVVRLFEEAAPRTLPLVIALAEDGYYDGLVFGHTQPWVEVALTPSSEGELVRFDMEIDAEALGLDEDKIADPGEAMDLMQETLFSAYTRNRRTGKVTEQLVSWIETWNERREASFLVGRSRMEINEALGYVYERGLASRPAVRGNVILRQASPGVVTPELAVLLTDIPGWSGKQMVIGEVTSGLEAAIALSQRPLLGRHRGGRYEPENPVPLTSLRFFCQEVSDPGPTQ